MITFQVIYSLLNFLDKHFRVRLIVDSFRNAYKLLYLILMHILNYIIYLFVYAGSIYFPKNILIKILYVGYL